MKEFDIGRWREDCSMEPPTAMQTILKEIDFQLGDCADLIRVDVQGIKNRHPGIRNPLKVIRDKIFRVTSSIEGDQQEVYYTDMSLAIIRVKRDPAIPGSPVDYLCQRLSECPDGFAPTKCPESRMGLHMKTSRFIIGMVDKLEGFTTHELRSELGLPCDDNGLKKAGQELEYFTRQMVRHPDSPDGWRSWAFVLGSDEGSSRKLIIRQAIEANAKRAARGECRDPSKRGRSIASQWLVRDVTGVKLSFDTRLNAMI
jgi:hypothetical protein